jgi:hypothetical protein
MDPDDNYFVPKQCVAWLIGINDYSRVRTASKEPKPHCEDLGQVPEDIARMAGFFETLRFDRVIKTENPDSQQMDDSFTEIKRLL